jgi:hypothetical protein
MSNYARVGGIFSIISGGFMIFPIIGIVFMVVFLGVMTADPFLYGEMPPDMGFDTVMTFMVFFYGAMGLLMLLTGVLGIIGGIFALKRKNWGLALAGAIAGTFTFFPCGIPAIIFVSLGRPEFLEAETTTGEAPPYTYET